jgi:hypothetical protein
MLNDRIKSEIADQVGADLLGQLSGAKGLFNRAIEAGPDGKDVLVADALTVLNDYILARLAGVPAPEGGDERGPLPAPHYLLLQRHPRPQARRLTGDRPC